MFQAFARAVVSAPTLAVLWRLAQAYAGYLIWSLLASVALTAVTAAASATPEQVLAAHSQLTTWLRGAAAYATARVDHFLSVFNQLTTPKPVLVT